MIWIATPSTDASGSPVIFAVEASEVGTVALGAGATQHKSRADLVGTYAAWVIIWPDGA